MANQNNQIKSHIDMDECSAKKLNIKYIAFGCYLSPAQIVMVILSQSSFKFKTQFSRPKTLVAMWVLPAVERRPVLRPTTTPIVGPVGKGSELGRIRSLMVAFQ